MTTAIVLLSNGLHPVSFRPCPVGVELQAIGVARCIADTVIGLHAGAAAAWHTEWAGYGLDRLIRIEANAADPLSALLDAILKLQDTDPNSTILAGRRGQGGEDAGLLPYRLAASLDRPLVADVVAVDQAPDSTMALQQWRPHAARRVITPAGSVVMTIHPAAPPASAFVFDYARQARIEHWEARFNRSVPILPTPADERPYRKCPPVLDRQLAGQGTRVFADLSADMAARIVLAHLRSIGILSPP